MVGVPARRLPPSKIVASVAYSITIYPLYRPDPMRCYISTGYELHHPTLAMLVDATKCFASLLLYDRLCDSKARS